MERWNREMEIVAVDCVFAHNSDDGTEDTRKTVLNTIADLPPFPIAEKPPMKQHTPMKHETQEAPATPLALH